MQSSLALTIVFLLIILVSCGRDTEVRLVPIKHNVSRADRCAIEFNSSAYRYYGVMSDDCREFYHLHGRR